MTRRLFLWAGDAVASMGPSFCKDGNGLTPRGRQLVPVASMGPSFCKDGNLEHFAPRVLFTLASMGPSFCKDGNNWPRTSW